MGECGTIVDDTRGAVASETINFAGCQIDKILKRADELRDDALEAAAQMEKHAKDAFDRVMAVGPYDAAKAAGVPQEFVPWQGVQPLEPDFSDLVPEAPKMPDPDEPLVGPCEYDAMFDRAQAKIAKVNRKATHDALYKGGRAGIGMASPSLSMALREANYENNGRTTEAALEQVVTEANHKREDKRDLYGLQAQIYQASASGAASYLNAETQRFLSRMENVKTHLATEAERRGWSEMRLKVIMEEADKAIAYALEQAKTLSAVLQAADEAITRFLSAMGQGLYAAANVSISGGGSYSGSDSTSTSYNYSGEVANQ